MKRLPLLVLMVLLLQTSVCAQSKPEFRCKFYGNVTSGIDTLITQKLKSNADRITSDLDVIVSDTFTIHIWATESEYLDAQEANIGARYYGSTGYVLNKKEIGLLDFYNIVEVSEHEFAHCISIYVNSSIGRQSPWLWEAIATYEAKEFYHPNTLHYLVDGNFPTMQELTQGLYAGNIMIYQVGYLIIEYIIDNWSAEAYVDMVKSDGDFMSSLGVSEEEFNQGWKSYIQKKYFGISDVSILLKEKQFQFTNQFPGEITIRCMTDCNMNLITLYDMQGRVVVRQNVLRNEQIHLTGLTGAYIIAIRNEDEFMSEIIRVR